jgi:hypothetical protein
MPCDSHTCANRSALGNMCGRSLVGSLNSSLWPKLRELVSRRSTTTGVLAADPEAAA